MASTEEYKNFVIDKLSSLENISCRPMMGEYILYYNSVIFGGIYDNRLLIKITEKNRKYGLKEVLPYKGGKTMFVIENANDTKTLQSIVQDTYESLKR